MTDKDRFQCAYPEYDAKRESTTFWDDFSIADAFGVDAIQDTYNRAFKEWKSNYKYLTELIAALNHKIWFWYELEGESSAKSKLYDKLWREADAWACENLKGEEATFYFMVTD